LPSRQAIKEYGMSSNNTITPGNTSTPRAAFLDEAPANDADATNTPVSIASSQTTPNRLVSDSPLFRGSPQSDLGNGRGTLIAGRDFPPDAFVDTTTHPTFVPVGPYTYSREARLRESLDGVSISANVKLTNSSDGRSLRVRSDVAYQDTTGKPIASVTVREYATVRGTDQTGVTFTIGGQGNGGPGGVGGGGTVGGGQNSGVVAIDGQSRQFDYKYDVTVTYKDGTSTRVQTGASTEPR
jgi:hypothetical protein